MVQQVLTISSERKKNAGIATEEADSRFYNHKTAETPIYNYRDLGWVRMILNKMLDVKLLLEDFLVSHSKCIMKPQAL